MAATGDPYPPEGSPRVLRVAASGAQSRRSRALVWVIATLILLLAGVLLAYANVVPLSGAREQNVPSPAVQPLTSEAPGARVAPEQPGAQTPRTQRPNAPASGSVATRREDGAVQAEWDGPAVHLDWMGVEYAKTSSTFIGGRLVSPGDRVERTLRIVNDAAAEAVASVTIDLSEEIPDTALNPDLASDVMLFWNVEGIAGQETFAQLMGSRHASIAELAVQPGAEFAVTIGFEMDIEADGSYSDGELSAILSFDVGVELTGERKAQSLTLSGAASALLAAAVGLGLLLVGVLLFAFRRRGQECDDCGEVIARNDAWVQGRDADGTEWILCAECHARRTGTSVGCDAVDPDAVDPDAVDPDAAASRGLREQ